MSIEQDTKKYEILATAIRASIEAQKAYHQSIIDMFFDENGISKKVEIEVTSSEDGSSKFIEVPAITVLDFLEVEIPKPLSITDIKIAPESKEISELKHILSSAYALLIDSEAAQEKPELTELIRKRLFPEGADE